MTQASARPGMLTLAIKDKAALHAAYMSFVRGGGLFVATPNTRYKLGDEVFLLLNFLDEKQRLPVAGKVVWITPAKAQGGRPSGVGVQFSETPEAEKVRAMIETQLAGMIDSDRPTSTI